MLKVIQIIITLLIIASLILQILVLLGNFSGLRNVNIIRVDLVNPTGSGGFFGGLLDKFKDTIDNQLPDFLTIGLFVICEGNKGMDTVCSPASFGYQYNSTGVLDLIQKEIPSSIQSTLSGVQKGVFILSAAICFFLLLCNFYHQYSGRKLNHHYGCCRIFLIVFVTIIALLFAIATFVGQIVAYNIVKSTIYKTKNAIMGGLINDLVDVQVKTGASVWLSLAAFISLFFVCILLLLSLCCVNKKSTRNESYEMGPVAS
ncbi:actin cortical patch SUR7/pH-response regulator pali [Helicostylum pulchrum]|nr:actin cortical patch SUR7/pH-response regulator pali [Helicostylum pulchrum]